MAKGNSEAAIMGMCLNNIATAINRLAEAIEVDLSEPPRKPLQAIHVVIIDNHENSLILDETLFDKGTFVTKGGLKIYTELI